MRSEHSRAPELAALAGALAGGCELCDALDLSVGDWRVRIESDSAELVARLRRYFRYFPGDGEEPDDVIRALHRTEPIDLGLSYRDWPREGGKQGRKDEYADVAGGRVVRKVRTGMHFLIGRDHNLAAGDCVKNDNQVVNFVNALYMNRMLAGGYVLCHAAAVTRAGRGLAIAAVSGGGKSTLALHLLGRGFSYVSNDRVLIRRTQNGARMSGVPKLPRINPGTALRNPKLAGVLAPERAAELASLDTDALWTLEEKYDVFIDEHFETARFELCSALDALIVLTWDRRASAPARLGRVDLAQRPDVLAAVMKSVGPFQPPADGEDGGKPGMDPRRYLEELAGLAVYEVSGGVDFDRACHFALNVIESGEALAAAPACR